MAHVSLHVYDLSNGLAKTMSMTFLGKQIDGVWHTGIVVYGKEYFFGGGIQQGLPGRTPYGSPVESISLGNSHIPQDVFVEFLQEISSRFSMESYDLLHNNCNNFTNECSIFLTGSPIPEYIIALPSEVLNTPFGPMIEQMMKGVQQGVQQGGMPSFPPSFPSVQPHNGPQSTPAFAHPLASHPLAVAAGASELQDRLARADRQLADMSAGVGGRDSGAEAAHSTAPRGEVGLAAAARSYRPHAHEELVGLLPTLSSFDKPLLLQDAGDHGAAAMMKLRALLQARHADKSSEVPEEEAAALAAIEELLQTPVAQASNRTLPKACYRFFARVLAKWQVASWGPALDLMRLLVLYDNVALHYAGTASSHWSIIVKRCLSKSPANSQEVPKGVKLRALFLVINMFAHACGVQNIMRPGASSDMIDAALDLINSPDATVRMSAAAVLFNICLYLPKEEGFEMAQISSGVADRFETDIDDESGFRLLLALGKLCYCNSSATQFMKSLSLKLEKFEEEQVPEDSGASPAAATAATSPPAATAATTAATKCRAMAAELKIILAS